MNQLCNTYGYNYRYHDHIPICTGANMATFTVTFADFELVGLYSYNIATDQVDNAIYEYKIPTANLR